MLVMSVIDAIVPGGAQSFIKSEILEKLGITNYSWETHVSGLPQAGWMVSMTAGGGAVVLVRAMVAVAMTCAMQCFFPGATVRGNSLIRYVC